MCKHTYAHSSIRFSQMKENVTEQMIKKWSRPYAFPTQVSLVSVDNWQTLMLKLDSISSTLLYSASMSNEMLFCISKWKEEENKQKLIHIGFHQWFRIKNKKVC